ncbi:hypothetical protein BDW22DRAFT_78062 [Trametopsis cervina]|nr:hypothetical protein BDW22DRAFT_78062 [Trametopsis cervina]
MSSSTAKLTKKQKKALAFREHRGGKGKQKATGEEGDNDVPVMEDQNLAEVEAEGSRVESKANSAKGGAGVAKVVERKKRKREEGAEEEKGGDAEEKQTKGKGKKRKVEGDAGPDAVEEKEGGEADGVESKGKSMKQQRFILFIGNLKYTTTKEAIQEHFAKVCDPPPEVRLITPKPSANGRPVAKSKGCAFLEFKSKPPLQQALKLHQSTLDSRMINVELTAGGGGKSEGRMSKLKVRNKELHEQRKKKLEKGRKSHESEAEVRDLERPQRYSATSGMVQAPIHKHTWSIPNEADGETRSRGKKKSSRPAKTWGTGVNAIPVG